MASNGRKAAPPASAETKINIWLNVAAIVVPLIVVVIGGLYALGSFTATVKSQIGDLSKDVDLKLNPIANKVGEVSAKVDSAAKDAQNKVDRLSDKVDSASALTQSKQDALAKTVEVNQADQQTFRATVQAAFTKLFDQQNQLANQINQERVDRLTEAAKKK